MFSLSFTEFSKLTKKGNLIPLYAEIPADLDTPVSAFLKIRTGRHDFLLESVEGGETWGRYSFLGTDPMAVFRSWGQTVKITYGKKTQTKISLKDPLMDLKELMNRFKPVVIFDLPRFYGGAVGFLSYDMVRHFEKLPSKSKRDLKIPECYFSIADTVIIFDNLKQVIKIVKNIHVEKGKSLRALYSGATLQIKKTIKKLQGPIPPDQRKFVKGVSSPKKSSTLKPSKTEKEYMALVERAREYVKAGDIFQVQVSVRFEGKTGANPIDLYRAIRQVNPSPYLYYLHFDSIDLVGASPELMVRVEGEEVELRPIAGTRRRGHTPEEDRAMEEELKADPKERAEHIMLVDLGRNDLGRVCQSGTVKVDELEVVERYSHVMHLVSQVSGKLHRGQDAYDVIRATFPAGTLTGAPKIRAMEIIEELEGVRRGVYGGCVGYIGFSGNLDMAITIRTALFHQGKIYVQAAGGIVYDSVPRLEYKECNNKARAMLEALKKVKGKE